MAGDSKTQLFTTHERSALEELEAVLARRVESGQLSLVGANGVAHAIYEQAATQLDAALQDAAAAALGVEEDDDGEDGTACWEITT